MAETSIEWTDATWNPVAGCSSYGRLHELLRHADGGQARGDGHREIPRPHPEKRGRAVWTGKIRLDHASLDTPKTWSKPRKVFVNSMSDLFHDDVPVEFIARVWDVMKDTPRHSNPHETP
jgi:protein gp37